MALIAGALGMCDASFAEVTYAAREQDDDRPWDDQAVGGGARRAPGSRRGTGDQEDPGLLRIDFPGYSGEQSLERISWDEFFEKFDEKGLALVYEERTSGGEASNFNKLVKRQTAEQKGTPRSQHKGER